MIYFWYRTKTIHNLVRLETLTIKDIKGFCQSIYGIYVDKEEESNADNRPEWEELLFYLDSQFNLPILFLDDPIYLRQLRNKYAGVIIFAEYFNDYKHYLLSSRYLNGRYDHYY